MDKSKLKACVKCGKEFYCKPSHWHFTKFCSRECLRTDLAGHRFGRLLVVERVDRVIGSRTRVYWRCQCDCGGENTVCMDALQGGHTQSCGCLKIELMRAKKLTHGQTGSLTYHSWSGMKDRCYNTNHPFYADWGGRGIAVCPRWIDSFENFLEDMGERPNGMSIDRIDNDDGYCKENCRWATSKEQNNNRRKRRWRRRPAVNS